MVWWIGWSFLAASVVSLPLLYLNYQGGRLANIGPSPFYFRVIGGFAFSLGNVRPWEVNAWYPALDLLQSLILAAGFVITHRMVYRIERQVQLVAGSA